MQVIYCGDPEFLFLIFCNLFSFFFVETVSYYIFYPDLECTVWLRLGLQLCATLLGSAITD